MVYWRRGAYVLTQLDDGRGGSQFCFVGTDTQIENVNGRSIMPRMSKGDTRSSATFLAFICELSSTPALSISNVELFQGIHSLG